MCLLSKRSGFTLIELSVVLVIIGLIVGGVLVGRDLIAAAAVRAQISQLEQYSQAVNTFRGKYNYLPGDIKEPDATNFGFTTRGAYAGQGDGNGILEGVVLNAPATNYGNELGGGETSMFWADLSKARLINESFTLANILLAYNGVYTATSTPSLDKFFPLAKIGNNNYIYAWSADGTNYYSISGIIDMGSIFPGLVNGVTAMTVAQASAIDKKIDDGFAQLGSVQAIYLTSNNYKGYWAGTALVSVTQPYTTSVSGSATSCFDNGGVAGTNQQYSVGQNAGRGLNCALTFKLQ